MKSIGVAALFLVLAGTSYAQVGDPARGSILYHTTYKCTACHGDPPNPNLPFDKLLLNVGTTTAGILIAINNPEMMNLYLGILDQRPQDMADLAAYIATLAPPPPPPPPPPAGTTLAVEYYYAAWGFYFETAFPDEIAALDGGAFGGVWQRTGQTFNVWPQPTGSASPTCRFFSTTFAPRSSHFYTPFSAECDAVKANPNWEFESIAFYIQLADANGVCPAGTIPLYRAYNNGMGGAPNHRYTTSLAVLNQMIAEGYVFEGNQVTQVFACVPG